MDEARYQEAKQAYDTGDYRGAAKAFLAAAGSQPEGSGAAYHMAGNSLMRLRRHGDAVTVYGQALKDEIYDRRGALFANLAAANVALGEYPEAVEAYDHALEEPDYTNQYRALQGKAGALFEMGRFADAAGAYRQAALDGDNPDPGKALNNLGLCFMAIGRPADAVEAYKAALGFDTYAGRGKALANLGLAFHALSLHEDAVKSFEKSIQLHGHELSEQMRTSFELSRAALERPEREVIDGWSTGEIPPVIDAPGSDDAQADRAGSAAGVLPTASSGVPPATDASATGELFGEETDGSAFFTMTDEEMKEKDRVERRVERQVRRSERNPWTLVATIVVLVIVIVAAIAAAYFSGLGFPTQSMTVTGMLQARAEGEPVDGYWVAAPSADVDKDMAKLPPIQEFQVDSVERSPATSQVAVTVTPKDGSPLRYEITLAREGVGWKVTGVENDWRSTGGGS